MHRVNKKGWLHIVEATFAVLIILGAALLLSSDSVKKTEDNTASRVQEAVHSLAVNQTMRNLIISSSSESAELEIENYVKKTLNPAYYIVSARVCPIEESCEAPEKVDNRLKEGDLYIAERVVSSFINSYPFSSQKLVRLYIWQRQ